MKLFRIEFGLGLLQVYCIDVNVLRISAVFNGDNVIMEAMYNFWVHLFQIASADSNDLKFFLIRSQIKIHRTLLILHISYY